MSTYMTACQSGILQGCYGHHVMSGGTQRLTVAAYISITAIFFIILIVFSSSFSGY